MRSLIALVDEVVIVATMLVIGGVVVVALTTVVAADISVDAVLGVIGALRLNSSYQNFYGSNNDSTDIKT